MFGEAGRKQAEALVRKAVFDEIEREKLIKAGEIQAEQLFWRDAGKEQAQLMIDQKPLFDVVEGQQIPEDIQELVNYYASLEDAQKAKDPESAAKSAPIIKICFDDKKPDTVEVSISESESDENGYAVSEKVYIQKSFTIDRAKREVIPTLCKKFIENGEIESNICHSARNNETLIRAEGKYDLSVIGTLQKTLQFTNIDEEVLGLVEELLNIKVSRHDFEVPGLGIKTL